MRWLLAAVLALSLPSVALAHGGRPQTYDVLFGATDADMVVPGTFGVMATLDGGATWDWLCIEGMPDARRGAIRPAVRTSADSVLFAQSFGLLDGRQRACDPIFDTTLQNRFVADVTARPGGGYAAVSSDANMENHLFVSPVGDAFAAIGDAFPAGFLPERVRYAPSDAIRVYVSGEALESGTSTYSSSLLVSTDGGMHWSVIDVPLMSDESVVRLLAVDPADAGHFFVVAQASVTDRLIEGTMSGASLRTVLQIPAVPIAVNRPFGLGFASDGTVWFGNTMAGLYRITGTDRPDSIDKHLHVACVVPHGDDVYFCGDGLLDVFALGVQHPGAEYAPVALMQFAQLDTQRTCGTSLDAVCAGWWNDLLLDTGRASEIPPDAGIDAAVNDASTDASNAMDGGSPEPTASCRCSATSHQAPSPALLLLLFAISWRARSACRPSS